MGKSDSQRYYWLKMPLDFFDSDKIKLLKGCPNGSEYVIFYLRLLLMAANREGKLRLDDEIPYDPETLAILTDTNVDVVKGAIAALERLRMLDILDDHTIYMSEIDKLVGSETKGAERKRIYRGKSDNVRLKADNVPLLSSKCPRDIDIEKEIEIDREIDKEKSISSVEDIPKEKARSRSGFDKILDSNLNIAGYPDLRDAYIGFIQMRKAIKKPLTDRGLQLIIGKVEKLAASPEDQIAILNQSIENSWQGVFELKQNNKQTRLGRVVGGNEFTALKEQEGYTGSNIFGG